jgi:predicted glycoside hydrolase/deacetylase ChbG (UPF0249 family)
VVIELAQHYHVPVRNPVPESVYGRIRIQGSNSRSMAVREVARFAARRPRLAMSLLPHINPAAFKRALAELDTIGIHTTNWFVDAFYNNARVESMVALIEQLPPGISEVASHPGFVDEALRQADYGYVEPRAAELAVLLDARVKAALQRCRVELVDFSFLSDKTQPGIFP